MSKTLKMRDGDTLRHRLFDSKEMDVEDGMLLTIVKGEIID